MTDPAASSQAAAQPGWKRPALIAGAIVVLLLLALAAWWWLIKPRPGAGDDAARARLQAVLERQRELTDELAKAKPADPTECPPGQTLKPIARGGTASGTGPAGAAGTGAGPGPGASGATAQAGPGPQGAASEPAPLPAGGEAGALGNAALAQRLEQATAIVIVAGPNDLGTGTGFFIGPNTLVTNRHVIEDSKGKRLFVTSKSLGTLRRATVLYATRSSEPGTPDFALLRLDDGSAVGTLDVAADVNKLANVVAAGYPGVVLRGDANFRRLLEGDLSAAPDLNLTQGTVQSFQSGEGGMPLIVHTASIAKGNSGGPLVDGCGRVIGVNTFINVDQSQSAKINYAIRSQVMAGFLKAAGANARSDPRPCAAKG
jgi:S1-C subfamily serine protease